MPLRKQELFFNLFFNVSKFQRPLSSRGGGELSLNGLAIKRRGGLGLFFNLFFQRLKVSTAIKLEGGRGVRP